MRKIKFVSYDGKWPNLCRGSLTLGVDGAEMTANCKLVSGGKAGFDKHRRPHISSGAWEILFEDDFFTKEEQEHIVHLVNRNVKWGCCGGCL